MVSFATLIICELAVQEALDQTITPLDIVAAGEAIDSDSSSEANSEHSSEPMPAEIDSTQPPIVDLESEGSEDEMHNSTPATVGQEGTRDTSRVGRQLVHKDHVKVLVKSYHKAFAEFKRSRKGVPTSQLIPSKVWKQVFKEYRKQFPNSSFKEDSLRDHLRLSLKDLASNTQEDVDDLGDDPDHDEQLMERLMATDSWKARNILQSRMDAMHEMAGLRKKTPASNSNSGAAASATSPESGGVDGVPPTPSTTKEKPAMVCKPPTKSQNLKDAREDMAAMLGEFRSMSEERRADSNRKRLLAEKKVTLQEAKRHESEERRATLAEQRSALAEQAKMSRITLLKEQKALHLITEDQFTQKCKEVFGL